jgi:broad specificity phosphatase PhoE
MEQRFGEAEAARRYELLVSNGLQFDVFEGLVEASQSLRARVVEAIEGIISANPGRRVAVFSHAPPIAAYVAHVMASPFDFALYPRLTSISIVLARQERRQLQLLNATPHFGVL